MKCPHCLDSFHSKPKWIHITSHKGYEWMVSHEVCPSCRDIIITLVAQSSSPGPGPFSLPVKSYPVYPRAPSRSPISIDVPERFAQDYKEASLVLSDSPKASAAVSRRCLQNVLLEKGGVKGKDLSKQIEEVLQSQQLPSHLAEGIDAIRNIGNFAAHPIKSTNTGEIVDVEPGEAEWLLDLLEGLFDFYFVQPAILKRKREELNKKLTDAGKPIMK